MNDARLKNPEADYFEELLARIRDIRSSEKLFYKKILEHRAEKWTPVFGKKRCSIKHLEPHA